MKKTLLIFIVHHAIFFYVLSVVPNTNFTGILGLDAEAYEFGGETGDSLAALPHAIVGDTL